MKYATETLDQVIEEIKGLAERNYSEIAEDKDAIPLDIDWGQYAGMERNGALKIFTARVDGKLVGYNVMILCYPPRYRKTLVASNEVIYVLPEHRGEGGALIDYSDKVLKGMGVVKTTYHIKDAHDWSPMMLDKGYRPFEKIVSKVL